MRLVFGWSFDRLSKIGFRGYGALWDFFLVTLKVFWVVKVWIFLLKKQEMKPQKGGGS